MVRTLLVIDDDEPSCRLVKAIFKEEGFDVSAAFDGATGLERVTTEKPELVLLDLKLGKEDGLEVLTQLKAMDPLLPVVMLSGDGELRAAVRATQLGAFDFLEKPIDHEEIVVVVRRALETKELQREVADLRRQLGEGGSLTSQMGSSPQMRRVIDQVRTVSDSNLTVLIEGETGTGKELVAQAIHRESSRRQKPFIALDCGAIPGQLLESELFGHERGAFTGAHRRKAGRFELAEGGTFFLDEVSNLPMTLQAKLLRVLESRQVQTVGGAKATSMDVRFVAATNNDLQARVTEGEFRADLYFRLAQYTILLPPLRERPTDIKFLAQRFLEEATLELRRPVHVIDPDAMEALEQHLWPGNVRELRNVIRQGVLQTKDHAIHRQAVRELLGKAKSAAPPAALRTAEKSLKDIADEAANVAEREAISQTLRATKGNKSQAARALRTDYKTLHLKMKKFGMRGRDFSA
jgi:DNA-binding NtrC family response regulator